ncbi:MAG: hypothetical protein R3C56_16145 [Pirellulaceae bacterium]
MRVLLATDGSKYAEHAASLLARLPHSQPLELAILAVTPLVGFHGSLDVVEWMERNQEAEKQRVAEACRRIEGLFEELMSGSKRYLSTDTREHYRCAGGTAEV